MIDDELRRAERELAEARANAMRDERWMIGVKDWQYEGRLLKMEKLVEDALRTDANYERAAERLRDVKTLRLLHVAMGLATEAGEFVDQLKRHIFYGTPIDEKNLIEELGDTSWYQRVGCASLEVAFLEMLERNVRKLKTRYPEKFTEEAAVNRDLEAERRAL